MVVTECNIEHGHPAQKLTFCRGTPRGRHKHPVLTLLLPTLSRPMVQGKLHAHDSRSMSLPPAFWLKYRLVYSAPAKAMVTHSSTLA